MKIDEGTLEGFADALKFDETGVQTELETHSERQFEVGIRTATAHAIAQTARADRKKAEASESLNIRAAAAQNKERITEGVVTASVAISKAVTIATAEEIEAGRLHESWKALDEAYKVRSILLSSAAKFAMANGG